MKQKAVLLWIILACPFYLSAQQKCDCEATFKWVKETFEKNDAGFEYALQRKGKDSYEKNNAVILNKVKKAITNDECADVIREWLSFFRKAHFAFFPNNNNNNTLAKVNTGQDSIVFSEDQIKQSLSNSNTPTLEGIWHTGAYKIGIVKKNNITRGIILASSNNAWKPHWVKLKINQDSSGVYYMGDHSPQKFDKAKLLGKNTLKLGSIYLDRLYPKFQENDTSIALYLKEISTDVPFIQKVSANTTLFRIPSFIESEKKRIDSLIQANETSLKSTENLIIDLRNNGGGSDDSYGNIIPFLYTNPIRIVNLEFLSTPLNNKRMEEYLSIPDLSEKNKKDINSALKKLNDNPGKFVNLEEGRIVDIQKLDSVLPKPKHVAVIINENNGSTTEQFLLAAKQSKKVKLYGVTTMGVLDISNMYFIDSPDKAFKLGYCLSKSYRIPDMAIDGKGIMPDYYIDKSIPDEQWLSFVQNILEE